MAREHIISIWCDPCMELDDIKEEGQETPPISLGNQKPRVLALCKQHWTDFYEPLEEFVSKFGVPLERLVDAPTTRKRPHPSPVSNHKSVPPAPTQVTLPNGYMLPKNVSAEKAPEYRVVCPVPDCLVLQKNANQAAGHLRNVHDTNLFETIGREGTLYDLDGKPVKTPKPRPYNGQGRPKAS